MERRIPIYPTAVSLCRYVILAICIVSLLSPPVFSAESTFWRCFDTYCQPHNVACQATLCSDPTGRCSTAPCGIFNNRGGPCVKVCSSVGSLFEKEACNTQYMDFAAACMSGCVQPDEQQAFKCAWNCEGKAKSLRKQCWELVKTKRMKADEAAKIVFPARKRGAAGDVASGERFVLHNGKVFAFSEEKWKRRVLRDIPPETGAFYTDEFDPLRMDWSSDGVVFLTGVGTAAAVTVGAMTFGSAIIVGAGVTFAASGLKTFISKSADTLDTKEAAVEGLKDGAWDATVGVGFDVATGGAGGAVKGAASSAAKTAMKGVFRTVAKKSLDKAVAPIARTSVGKSTVKAFRSAFKDPLVVRLERKLVMSPKGGKPFFRVKRVFSTQWNTSVTVLTSGDAVAEGIEMGLTNRISGCLNNTSRQAYDEFFGGTGQKTPPDNLVLERGRVGDSSSGVVITYEGGGI